MAIVKFDDGSEVELSEEEFILYLKATGKYVAPKSQAEIIIEKMAEIRDAERNGAEPTNGAPVVDVVEQAAAAAAEAQQQAQAGRPTPAVMPKTLASQVGVDRPKKLRIPVTEKEFEIIRVIREYHRMGKVTANGVGISTKGIASVLEMSQSSASGFLSGLFQTNRGIYRSIKNTWLMHDWALNADWDLMSYPNNHWPPQEGIPRS